MWTPRRILLVVVGLCFFGAAYGIYAHFLGFVDGLPTLPSAYAERMIYDESSMPRFRSDGNPTAQRIRQAFGPNAPELRYYIKADSKAKGLLVVGHEIEMPKLDAEGKVTITPCSVAIFGKARGQKGEQEITTMHCDRAILQFDAPVKKWSDMEGRRIVAAELRADPDVPLYHPYKGMIRITNNRRSNDPDDLVEMRTPGPIFYRAEPEMGTPHIWTDNVLEVTDRANLPEGEINEFPLPTMTAKGMKLYLSHEPKDGNDPKKPPLADPNKKPNPAAVTGVERVDLLSDVSMNLWIDPKSSFLANSKDNNREAQEEKKAEGEKKPEGEKKKERSIVQIRTLGAFVYDMPSDKARFDKATHVSDKIPNYVQVTRQILGSPNRDIMTSDYLELQFRRKKPQPVAKGAPAPPPEPKTDKSKNPEATVDIDTVHAWGATVVISSDSEEMTAYGNDLRHDNVKQETVLKGDRIIVVKEGNQITAKELILSGFDKQGTQSARVRGPGQIDVGQVDPVLKDFVHTRQAQWEEWLTFDRVKEQGRDLDVLTLTGGAKFIDKLNDQFISARQLKVWINPATKSEKEKLVKSDAPPKKDGLPKVRPNRMEASGDVIAHGVEIDVKNTDYLNVFFKEVAFLPGEEPRFPPTTTNSAISTANPMNPPSVPAITLSGEQPKSRSSTPAPAILTANPMNPPAVPAANNPPVVVTGPIPKGPPKKKNPPINLTAKRIEAWVLMSNNKNDLERVHCEDQVIVHQDGTEDSPTGIDLEGKTLDLNHRAEGNVLIVTGTKPTPGEVRFDKVTLIGEEITINQLTNVASVKGPGTVRMLVGTNLRGEKLEAINPRGEKVELPLKPLTVHWQDGMEFRGADQSILFDGKVQATQDDAKVLCESMQVMLDRVVWINHLKRPKNEKSEDKTPKVDRVICDQQPKQNEQGGIPQLNPVIMIEETREQGKIVKYNYIEAREFDLDNLTRKLVVPGPGIVKIMQLGSKEGLAEQAQTGSGGKQTPPEQELKLTYVDFSGQMQARSGTNPQWARFFGPTEVIHIPANDPDVKFDRTRLPERGMRLRCKEELIVTTQKENGPDGKPITYQSLEAKGSVEVWADDFTAEASIVKYDQKRDTITFEGDRSLPAVIRKQGARGTPPRETKSSKIIYNRLTKEIRGENGTGFSQ